MREISPSVSPCRTPRRGVTFDLGTYPGCLSPIDHPHRGRSKGMKGMTRRDVLT